MMSFVEDAIQDSTGRESGNLAWDTGQGDQDDTGRRSGSEVSVYEAADILGVTVDAIRKRTQRGTIPHRRDEDGRVWVMLEADSKLLDTRGKPQDVQGSVTSEQGKHRVSTLLQAKAETIAELRDQVEYLRGIIETRDRELEARTEELRRRDIIISSITQRIPELPPTISEETPNISERDAGVPEEAEDEGDQALAQEDRGTSPRRRSWLARFFFGP